MTTVRGLRIARIASLTALLIGAIAACGGPSPAASPTSPVATTLAPVCEPAQTSIPTTEALFPPEPACPGPPVAPDIPAISAAVGDGATVIGSLGSFTIRTCSTSGSHDMAGGDPETLLVASPGDDIVVSVAPPWRVVQWEGFDAPVQGDAGNIWPPVRLPDQSRSFMLAVPARSGDSILSLDLLLVTDDGRAVGQVPVSFLVRVVP